MARTKISLVCIFLAALTVLSSCNIMRERHPLFVVKGGTEVYSTPDELIEDFYSTSADVSERVDPDETETTETKLAGTVSDDEKTDTVYWVKGGEVWHTTDKCQSLSRSKNILSGSIEDAMLAGKARVCKKCGK